MALNIYDEDKNIYGSLAVTGSEDGRFGPFRTHVDGRLGGSFEQVVYIRNDDVTDYYTDIVLEYQTTLYTDMGVLGSTGWGVKTVVGERRPTEAEWGVVQSGNRLELPDIGSTAAGDTSTYIPVWIRVYCPGGVAAQIRESQELIVSYRVRKVGT